MVVKLTSLSCGGPVVLSNFSNTGVFAKGDQTFMVKPLFIKRSITVIGIFTPAKAALAGMVFSATFAEVFTPVASGFAIT